MPISRFELLHQRRAAQVGAEDGDRLRRRLRDVAHHVADLVGADLREGEVVLLAQVPLGDAREARCLVVAHDGRLHVVEVRGHEAEARDAGLREDLVQREHGRARADAGRLRDPAAQPLVRLESEPSGRRAVPADDVDLGVGEKLRRAKDLAVVELAERGARQRDLRDLEAAEVRARLGNSGDHPRSSPARASYSTTASACQAGRVSSSIQSAKRHARQPQRDVRKDPEQHDEQQHHGEERQRRRRSRR